MKSAHDPRHQRRRELVQQLFALEFDKTQDTSEAAMKILGEEEDLDQLISKAAPAWPIEKLNRIDLAILWLAVHELKVGEVPPKVSIDEAVELAKEFGSESSPSFINGVLGTVLKNLHPNFEEEEKEKMENKD